MFLKKLIIYKLFIVLAVIFLLPAFAGASNTDGTIDGSYKYAWGENIGWLNFGATHGNVHVTDTGLSGYGWSENYGWINLNSSTAGVKNDGNGNLSGKAWAENLGWINFGGVTINSSGAFSGYATIENNNSHISFNCANTLSCLISDFKVKTDWRPRDSRPGGAVIIPQSGGQSSAPPPVSEPPVKPEKPKIQENKPKDQAVKAKTPSTAIPLKPAVKPVSPPVSPLELVLKKIKDIFGPVMSKLAKLNPLRPAEIPLERLVPRQAPLALRGLWQIMPAEPVKNFVFAPLPNEFKKLAEKFPSLSKIFEQINISKIADISRLNNITLTLPGLTAAANLPKAEMVAEKFALLQGMPLANLTAEIKKSLPSEIVFAKTGGELIDYNIDLTINEQGRFEQKITVLANQNLKLVIKPEGKVNAVKGYLIFKSAGAELVSRLNIKIDGWLIKPALAQAADMRFFAGRLQDFFSSLIFARPSLAFPQKVPVPVEEKLVLKEFDYTDTDGDGLWTAEVKMPAAAGQYEVITVLYYQDPEQGTKAIKLTTVIDPEGYIYENYNDKELRLPGVIVSLYWLNPEVKQYQDWPSEDYKQENPQITDISGKYSFLVPPGYYYLKVEAPGYLIYQGKPFQVKAGGAVHANIELKTKYGWLKNFDWKTILLILTAIFLAYNFYKDKFRARKLKINNIK